MSTDFIAPDGHARCAWCGGAPEFLPYHDAEWGFPVADDVRLFEKLCLEAFQSGLSWRTILNKREAFRAAFDGFDFHKMASYTEADVTRLLGDAGIVRHRGKIEAVIHNAGRAVELQRTHGSLAAFFWGYEPTATELAEQMPVPQVATQPPAAAKLAKALKTRGWKFVGPTTAFAFMQAMGLVNDHVHGCVTRAQVAKARQAFTPPKAAPLRRREDPSSWSVTLTEDQFKIWGVSSHPTGTQPPHAVFAFFVTPSGLTQALPDSEVPYFMDVAEDASLSTDVRAQAVALLGDHAQPSSHTIIAPLTLTMALGNEDARLRISAIRAQCWFDHCAAGNHVNIWMSLLQNTKEDMAVRSAAFDAVCACAQQPNKQAALTALLNDPDFGPQARQELTGSVG